MNHFARSFRNALAFAAALLLFPALAFAQGTAKTPGQDFQVRFQPTRAAFRTGEPIRFQVQGSKPFFLYLFNVDAERNRGFVLLPNAKQPHNRYEANRIYDVPDPHVEFYGDRPGAEKIIMLASTKELDVGMDGFAAKGDFFAGSAGAVEQTAKALGIRSREQRAEQVSREFSVMIVGPETNPGVGRRPAPPNPGERGGDRRRADRGDDRQDDRRFRSGDGAVSTFVSSNKTRYFAGETMKITFGADQKGFVHLYAVRPDGGRTFFRTYPVTGNGFRQIEAKATRPGGRHHLVAIFDQDANLDRKSVASIRMDPQSKDIQLIDDRPVSFAVYPLVIQE